METKPKEAQHAVALARREVDVPHRDGAAEGLFAIVVLHHARVIQPELAWSLNDHRMAHPYDGELRCLEHAYTTTEEHTRAREFTYWVDDWTGEVDLVVRRDGLWRGVWVRLAAQRSLVFNVRAQRRVALLLGHLGEVGRVLPAALPWWRELDDPFRRVARSFRELGLGDFDKPVGVRVLRHARRSESKRSENDSGVDHVGCSIDWAGGDTERIGL